MYVVVGARDWPVLGLDQVRLWLSQRLGQTGQLRPSVIEQKQGREGVQRRLGEREGRLPGSS